MSCRLRDLPEFYVLVESQNRDLEESSLAGSSSSYLAKTEKLKNLKKKIASQSLSPQKTISDEFYASMRRASRPIYSRGHEIHTPGSELPFRPYGESPIASPGVRNSPGGRKLYSSHGAGSLHRPSTGTMNTRRPNTRDNVRTNYCRPTSPDVMVGGRIGSPSFQHKAFNAPLTNITYTSPSHQNSSPTNTGYFPSDAVDLLEDSRFVSCGGFTLQSFRAKTAQGDRKYLTDRRRVSKLKTEPYVFPHSKVSTNNISTVDMAPSATFSAVSAATDASKTMVATMTNMQSAPAAASVDGILYKIDYEPVGSSTRTNKSVSRQRTF